MKIAVVGLGDIAKKAYLPVVMHMDDHECYLVTRNEQVRRTLGAQYKIPTERQFSTIQALLSTTTVDAVCIHTATEAHDEVVRLCLDHGIHVFVDKPLTSHFDSSKELAELAYANGCELMVGFNRRFAPLYRQLKEDRPHLLLMQKNRSNHPGEIREVVFDDFIHVVDTLRFLAPSEVRDVTTQYVMSGPLLSSIAIQLIGEGFSATGMMNRESGATEETLEVMNRGTKRRVTALREMVTYDGGEQVTRLNEWTSVGEARGFLFMLQHFFDKVYRAQETGRAEFAHADLRTHELCEQIVRQVTDMNTKG
jgi:virulence factor